MQNFNPYNAELFKFEFTKTDTYLRLKQNYDVVQFHKFFETTLAATPRQRYGQSVISAVPFYYLNYLDSYKQIADIGCGWNFFKSYFPSLIGIGAEEDPKKFYGDIHDFVDDGFYRGHIDAFDSAFSINALHFNPLEKIREISVNFSNMIRPGGRGFLAMNSQRLLECSTKFSNYSVDQVENYIRHQFDDFPAKILVFDLDLSVQDAWMDGNIRIVFEK